MQEDVIETEVMTNRFIGDGSNKAFPFSFRFNKGDDIQVWLYDDTTGEITQRSDFTLSPNDSTYPSNGGVVTFPSSGNAITANQMVIVQRHMDIFQLDPYKHGEFLQLDNFEKSLDTIVMEVQQVAEAAGRSIKYPLNQTDFDPTLPPLKDGQTIMVNDDENGWTVIDVKELFDQTHSAWVAASNAAESASVSQKWAESEESPDNQLDEDSDTGRTQSSKSWAIYSKNKSLVSLNKAEYAQKMAQDAANSAQDAANSAQDAANSAQDAANSAQDAANSAQDAEDSAQKALMGVSVEPWSEQETYSFPDTVVYTDGNMYRCIGENVVGELPINSYNWIRIQSVIGDFFDTDSNGDLMPAINPMYSNDFELDGNGDIMPINY